MAAPPIKIVVPPAPAKKSTNPYDKFIAAHAGLAQYKTTITQWAGEYGVPALWVAAVIWKESKGQNVPWNAAVKGAGLAQINITAPPGSMTSFLTQNGGTVQGVASDPSKSIQYLAYAMAASNAASVDDFYTKTWNPGFKATKTSPLPSGILKGYPVSVTGHTPVQKAAGSAAAVAAAKANAGLEAQTVKQQLDPIYLAYTGKPASPADIQGYIKNPISTYQVELNLADPKKNPGLTKSPVWKTNAPTYRAYYQAVFGPNVKVPDSVILYGVVHSLSESAFTDLISHNGLPGQQAYKTSEQYKGLFATYQAQYASIYGLPDGNGKQMIDNAIHNGWTADQFSNFLRKQPEYTSSGEFKQRALNLAQSMGLIQGAQTVLGNLYAGTPLSTGAQARAGEGVDGATDSGVNTAAVPTTAATPPPAIPSDVPPTTPNRGRVTQ